MDYTLSMVFLNVSVDKSNISISGVKPTVTDAETSALMDTIILKDVFHTDGGPLSAKYSAQLTERSVTKFTVQ